MTAAATAFLDDLQNATTHADKAEAELRKEFSARLKALEQERVFAYRRFNLMRQVVDAVAQAESEEIAVANALGVLRTRLSWHSDSEPRTAVLSQFAAVGRAVFLSVAPVQVASLQTATASDAQQAALARPDPMQTLRDFEAWYADKHGTPFWVLFENYMPETPVVDF